MLNQNQIAKYVQFCFVRHLQVRENKNLNKKYTLNFSIIKVQISFSVNCANLTATSLHDKRNAVDGKIEMHCTTSNCNSTFIKASLHDLQNEFKTFVYITKI